RYSLFAIRSKSEIDAAAHQIVVEAHVVSRRAAAVHVAVEAAEIDVEKFELGAPVAGERVLDAAAGGPADLRVGLTREARRRRVDVADRETAGHIGQEIAERVADAAARGAEPVVLHAAARASRHVRRAADLRAVEIALDAEHPAAELRVVA